MEQDPSQTQSATVAEAGSVQMPPADADREPVLGAPSSAQSAVPLRSADYDTQSIGLHQRNSSRVAAGNGKEATVGGTIGFITPAPTNGKAERDIV